MNYDVVIATRNRRDALKLSIPLILGQSHKPRRLIVVDASDDHKGARQTVVDAHGRSSVEVEILHCRPNLPHQRNVALGLVESPVVMFPDDDSLWWPGVAEAIMRIYEQDVKGDIGGVCGREMNQPPPGVDIASRNVYKLRIADRIRKRIEGVRHKFDQRFCPDPLWVHGKSCWHVRPFPEWLHQIDAALVEFMAGFRMSFRTEVIRKYGFDEDLGANVGYAAYEDADASFKVLQEKLLVGAHDAHVYHHKAPGRRANAFDLGFILLFNRAYIICRYSPPGSLARAALKRFALYKMSQYMLDIGSQWGRERVRGTSAAMKMMRQLLDAPASLLRQMYLESCQKALPREPLKPKR